METKDKGIIIKLSDYKEADKFASVFTLEQGVISANFKGVKKDNAKFKSVAQPFVLADFVFNETGSTRIVTSASAIDSFYGILNNYNKTIYGYIVLDMIKSLLATNKPEQEIFLLTLNALKEIEAGEENYALISYIIKFIEFSGMGIEFINNTIVYLDKSTGNFCATRQENAQLIDKKVYLVLLAVRENQVLDFSQNTIKQALRLLHNIIEAKFGVNIKSFEFI